MQLIIDPKSCQQDEKVCIKAVGFRAFHMYTLTSHLQDTRLKKYFSYAHYIADSAGEIDVSQNESVGGHYLGVFQMGLIAGLQPAPDEYKFLRIFKRDVEIPNKIEIRIYEGHKTSEEIYSKDCSPLKSSFHFRHYMGTGVQRLSIRDGHVRGTLFLPAGDGPFPGVVDLFGTAGGLLEFRSSQLATRGIAALALAFFGYDDLPETFERLDLSYFEEAVNVLLKHPKVLKPSVGVIGVSKGADVALCMATFLPQVSLAVSISGCCSVLGAPFKISENYTIPNLKFDLSDTKIMNKEALLLGSSYTTDPRDFIETIIPIQQSNAKFLFLVGGDDKNLNSKYFATISAQLLERTQKGKNCKVIVYEDAGHLIEPPYSSFCPASYHRVVDFALAWGGEIRAHTEAQEKAWIETLSFIKENLRKFNSKL